MPRFYVYTIRNGRRLLGNMGHVAAVWTDLKTGAGAMKRASRWALTQAKRNDEIIVERDNQDFSGESKIVGRFFF